MSSPQTVFTPPMTPPFKAIQPDEEGHPNATDEMETSSTMKNNTDRNLTVNGRHSFPKSIPPSISVSQLPAQSLNSPISALTTAVLRDSLTGDNITRPKAKTESIGNRIFQCVEKFNNQNQSESTVGFLNDDNIAVIPEYSRSTSSEEPKVNLNDKIPIVQISSSPVSIHPYSTSISSSDKDISPPASPQNSISTLLNGAISIATPPVLSRTPPPITPDDLPYASKKRNDDFHLLFPELRSEELLVQGNECVCYFPYFFGYFLKRFFFVGRKVFICCFSHHTYVFLYV